MIRNNLYDYDACLLPKHTSNDLILAEERKNGCEFAVKFAPMAREYFEIPTTFGLTISTNHLKIKVYGTNYLLECR